MLSQKTHHSCHSVLLLLLLLLIQAVSVVAQVCECANQATCDPMTGECLCAPGWSGVQCTDRKLLSSYVQYSIITRTHVNTHVLTVIIGVYLG